MKSIAKGEWGFARQEGVSTSAMVLVDQITIGKGDRSPTRMTDCPILGGGLWRGERGLDEDRRGREASQTDTERPRFRHEVPDPCGKYRIRGSSLVVCLQPYS